MNERRRNRDWLVPVFVAPLVCAIAAAPAAWAGMDPGQGRWGGLIAMFGLVLLFGFAVLSSVMMLVTDLVLLHFKVRELPTGFGGWLGAVLIPSLTLGIPLIVLFASDRSSKGYGDTALALLGVFFFGMPAVVRLVAGRKVGA